MLPTVAFAQNSTSAGTASAPHPTLESASIEWVIDGDNNCNGVVAVAYREAGGPWLDAMPLVRVPADSNEGFSWLNRHAGSIFGLLPGRMYEVSLTLSDPDGGDATTTLSLQTRPEPETPASATLVSATPETIDSVLAAAVPNTIVELAAGSYNEIIVANDGIPGQPIVIRGALDEEVTVNGDIRMDGRSHIWLQDLRVVGKVKFNNSSNLVVQRLLVETSGDGIIAYGQGTSDSYISDNIVKGSTQWSEAALGVNGDNLGEGIALTGPGNVIAYNRVTNFRDCISLLEDDDAIDQYSIDIIGNDLDVCADDAIEADFSMGNVRVVRNRMNNSFIALSSQPSLGGPTYFVRNVSFNNIFQVFKPNRGSVGDLWFHNTVVKPGDALGVYAGRTWSRASFRNNLFIGGTGGGTYNGFDIGSGRPIHVADADESCDFDYDGFGVVDVEGFSGRIGATGFNSFEELTQQTSEVNATLVDMSIFEQDVPFPSIPFPAHTMPDLRLAANSAAVDRGLALANLNDGFSGAAPDLGAYEFGVRPPHYGPRGDALCGNGVREADETCDDGNLLDDDGCDSLCQQESGPEPGNPDAGSGSGETPSDSGGCGCSTQEGSSPFGIILGLLCLYGLGRRRRWN